MSGSSRPRLLTACVQGLARSDHQRRQRAHHPVGDQGLPELEILCSDVACEQIVQVCSHMMCRRSGGVQTRGRQAGRQRAHRLPHQMLRPLPLTQRPSAYPLLPAPPHPTTTSPLTQRPRALLRHRQAAAAAQVRNEDGGCRQHRLDRLKLSLGSAARGGCRWTRVLACAAQLRFCAHPALCPTPAPSHMMQAARGGALDRQRRSSEVQAARGSTLPAGRWLMRPHGKGRTPGWLRRCSAALQWTDGCHSWHSVDAPRHASLLPRSVCSSATAHSHPLGDAPLLTTARFVRAHAASKIVSRAVPSMRGGCRAATSTGTAPAAGGAGARGAAAAAAVATCAQGDVRPRDTLLLRRGGQRAEGWVRAGARAGGPQAGSQRSGQAGTGCAFTPAPTAPAAATSAVVTARGSPCTASLNGGSS